MNELNPANFKQAVLESKKPVVVDFWAEWCGPCKQLAPLFEKTAGILGTKAVFCKLNIDEEGNADIAQKYNVMGIPCVLVFSHGAEVDRIVGMLPEAQFQQKLKGFLERA